MDPFEEFEFKPLTEGLGFHKKSVRLNDKVKKSGLSDENVGRTLPQAPPDNLLEEQASSRPQTYEDILAALETPKSEMKNHTFADEEDLPLTEPLPRKEETRRSNEMTMDLPIEPSMPPVPPMETPRTPSRSSIPKPSPALNRDSMATGVRRGAADSPVRHLVPAPISFSSAVLDFVMVFALSLVFLVTLLIVTKVEVMTVFQNAQTDLTTQLALGVLFISVMQMYVVISRSFFGRTLGEWTFDFQMGDDQQHKSGTYPIKVAWRSFVVTITGIVVLPLLSWIIRKDLSASLTGLQLYRQR